ncbi:ParA family protein [Nakamurella sp. PAMC28650]|uniref:ParA family protein n=1 Tax=Nakamurella sp. PAMC28650 TaxID=2762325 RepID=UPI002104A9A5|nr:ParA family protein [Nakamurella sp. PAMC28650]
MTTGDEVGVSGPMSYPDDAAWIAAAGATRALDTVPPPPSSQVPTGSPVDSADGAGSPADDGAAAPPTGEAAQPDLDASGALRPTPGDQEVVPALISKPGPGDSELGPTGRVRRTIPEPAVLNSHGPARVIAMCNQKGGVGKTTTTLNLGAALAEYGRRVLLVDLDPQGALSAGLGVPAHELDRTIYNLMLERNTSITDVLVPTRIPGMDLLPANIDLSAAEVQLINEVGREHTLARALRPMLHEYDYVLIDCQPSLGLLTVNALACAHGVIMPVAAEFFSLRGVALLVDTIDKVKDRINPDLEVDGVLVTMFDGRTVHARDVVAMLVQRFGDEVYDTVISRTVKFPETTVAGEPITTYAPTSPAADAFRTLAREVIAR